MLYSQNCRTSIHCSYICIGGTNIRLKCKNKTLQDIQLECPRMSCWNVPGRPLGMSWEFGFSPYLSILIHHHIIWACKKYTKKCLHSQKYSRTWSQWDKIGQNFAFIILKSTPAQKKVHHRWLWRLWQIWAMPVDGLVISVKILLSHGNTVLQANILLLVKFTVY